MYCDRNKNYFSSRLKLLILMYCLFTEGYLGLYTLLENLGLGGEGEQEREHPRSLLQYTSIKYNLVQFWRWDLLHQFSYLILSISVCGLILCFLFLKFVQIYSPIRYVICLRDCYIPGPSIQAIRGSYCLWFLYIVAVLLLCSKLMWRVSVTV